MKPASATTWPAIKAWLGLASAAALLSACGGGGSSPAAPAVADKNSVAFALQVSAPVATCADGGVTVQSGIDTNANGVLDTTEVTNTQYVCNGANGTNGVNGPSGANGTNGLSALVTVTPETAGTHCPAGGQKVSAGADANGNNTLDDSEITSSSYLCDGEAGAAGATGAAGAAGANGLNTLAAIVPDAQLLGCPYGGSRIYVGLDANGNGILDATEFTSSSYVCNGAPGATGAAGATGATGPAGPGITWVDVTTDTVQASSNTGYVADSASTVAVTLPANPAVGDLVQVTGAGPGGWKVVQQTGQRIQMPTGPYRAGRSIGTTWTARALTGNWTGLASSADGARLVVTDDHINTSSDAGLTWNPSPNAPVATYSNWNVASSSNGSHLVVIADGDAIYTSPDYGASWAPRDAVRHWSAVASSADGSHLVAAVYGGQIYTSSDYGVSWDSHASPSADWSSLASSSDGLALVAVAWTNQAYTSTDGGLTWAPHGPTLDWSSVASSADGMRLAGIAYDMAGSTLIYTSTDAGLTWTARATNQPWRSIASSADGVRLVAAVGGGQIYTSADSGASWQAQGSSRNWNLVATSADGTKLAGAVGFGNVYTSAPTPLWSTTTGTAGWLQGRQYDSIALQYIGAGVFLMINEMGVGFVLN